MRKSTPAMSVWHAYRHLEDRFGCGSDAVDNLDGQTYLGLVATLTLLHNAAKQLEREEPKKGKAGYWRGSLKFPRRY